MRKLESIVSRLRPLLARRSRTVIPRGEANAAAVLVPLCDVEGEPHVLFTERAQGLPRHEGQVAFPGGRFQEGLDRDLAATALREAEEEIGLDPCSVELLGALDDVRTLASNFVITPFVGALGDLRSLRPDPLEVAEVFTVPVSVLRLEESYQWELWDFAGEKVPIEVCRYRGHNIWGATLRITRSLASLIEGES